MRVKIQLIQGDITELNCDAIVNAANKTLLGGGGVDGAIHRKAGPSLRTECEKIGGCETGDVKLTRGYELKAKYVIHGVGPVWKNGSEDEESQLQSVYRNALKMASELGIRSIAFPNISTGIYGFPKDRAATIAIETVHSELKKIRKLKKVIFTCFDNENFLIYEKLLNGKSGK